jgi:putative transposase
VVILFRCTPQGLRAVGIDLGSRKYVVDSDGSIFPYPQWFRDASLRILELRAAMRKAKRGTREYKKSKKRLKSLKRDFRISHDRYVRFIAEYYIDHYDLIFVEDLSIKRPSLFHPSVREASWDIFIDTLENEAGLRGKTVIRVDPMNTTQMCSKCGTLVKKSVTERVHHCDVCGYMQDRDINASENILNAGLSKCTSLLAVLPENQASLFREASG